MASIRQARNEYNIIIDEHTYELTLQVKDTGKGMTSEEKQKVFQAFTRLKGAQGIEGTGLGLSITRELVALLGGRFNLNLRWAKVLPSPFPSLSYCSNRLTQKKELKEE